MEITGIILAGGKSSRMGEDKGLLLLDGIPMVQHVINALTKVVSDVIIISNNDAYKQFGVPVFSDLVKDKGPVGGIYTGLYYSKTEMNVCLSCDIPLISSGFLSWLIDKSKDELITVPSYRNKVHQLIGVYSKNVVDLFKENLDKEQLKLGLVNQEVGCKVVDAEIEGGFNETIFENINSRDELKKL